MEELESQPPPSRRIRSRSAVPRAAPRVEEGRPWRGRRPYSAYTKREGEVESCPKFDAPGSDREWWRFYMKDTPIPGTYGVKSFVDDLQKNPNSYRFRDSSRAKSACHQRFTGMGETLMPGAYQLEDFMQQNGKKTMTYGFKRIERDRGPKIGHGYGDKDLDTNPMMYDIVDYNTGANEKGIKTSSFKSHIPREISIAHQFRIVKGPGPGKYESEKKKSIAVSSSFKSKVPRFNQKPSKIPGPGHYSYNDSVFGNPKPVPAALHHMKKKHGLDIL